MGAAMIGLGWGVAWFVFWAVLIVTSRRERMKIYEMAERASAEGRTLPPEILDRLNQGRGGVGSDLRWGIILLFVSLGLCVAGVIDFFTYTKPHPQLFYGPYGLFPIPGFIGAAFLVIAWLRKKGTSL